MRKILIVPPASWGDTEADDLRAALNGTRVEISTGRSPELISGNDAVLIILGEYEPQVLGPMGQGTRDCGMDPHYASLPLATIVNQIKAIVKGENTHG